MSIHLKYIDKSDVFDLRMKMPDRPYFFSAGIAALLHSLFDDIMESVLIQLYHGSVVQLYQKIPIYFLPVTAQLIRAFLF